MVKGQRLIIPTITLLLLIISAGCVHGSSVRQKLDSYVSAFTEQEKFSGAVLVAKDNEVLLSKGYGMANYELNVPNTPSTKFRLASVSKQFTAMAIMQLREQGLLSVDDTLAKYVPEYPDGDKITIHHLLTHTSGIRDYQTFSDYKSERIRPHTLMQHISRFKEYPLVFGPGKRFQYSNTGYILLSHIVEVVSGKKYEAFLKEHVFDRLGMKDTGYDNHSVVLKKRASGYTWVEDTLNNADYVDMSNPHGAGALYSSIEDLYRWDQALYSDSLLSRKSLDAAFSSYTNNSEDPTLPGYGYGWRIQTVNGRRIIEHSGGIEGFSTKIIRYPDEKACIIILSNYENLDKRSIASGLAAIVFGESYRLPVKRVAVTLDPRIYDQYVGKYKLNSTIITIIKEGDKLFSKPDENTKLALYPESETNFFHKTIEAEVIFIKDDSGKVVQLNLRTNKDNIAQRID